MQNLGQARILKHTQSRGGQCTHHIQIGVQIAGVHDDLLNGQRKKGGECEIHQPQINQQ